MEKEEYEEAPEDRLYTTIKSFAMGEGCSPRVAHQIALRVAQMLIAVTNAAAGKFNE